MNKSHDATELIAVALRSSQAHAVRRRIIAQLLESLLYEGVIQPFKVEHDEETGQIVFTIHGQGEHGEPIVYRCCGEKKFSFGRLRIRRKPAMQVSKDREEEVENIMALLAGLSPTLKADAQLCIHFGQELQHTLLNDSIAQYIRASEKRSLHGLAYDDLEREIMDAHPYHPSYKSRIGFDIEDNLTYGPETGSDLSPLWLAVRRSHCAIAISHQLHLPEFFRTELGNDTYTRFVERIREREEIPDEYVFLPAHPWQWRKKIVPLLQRDIQLQHIIPLGYSADTYRPQQSIRTLANMTQLNHASLKLSLSIINTSTGRMLAPHTVRNAPLVSDWLQTIFANDSFLRDELRCILLGEVLGISYICPDVPVTMSNHTYGILGCIWRESIHTYLHLEDGEEAIPFSGLVHLDLNGQPYIDPWVQRLGIEAWVQALLKTCIMPLIHFLYAHGIALEAHAQNMILVHTQGEPRRAAFKDFHDGIRFSRQHLTDPIRCPTMVPTPDEHVRVNRNSFIETDDPLLVRDFMLDAFFFINLTELAIFLNEQYGFSEHRFWSLAHGVIENYQQRFVSLKQRFELFDVFTPTMFVEQLTLRRLLPDDELRLHEVRNPLAAVSQEVSC